LQLIDFQRISQFPISTYPTASNRFTRASSEASTTVEPAWRSLAFALFPQNLCEVLAWKRFTLPEPVSEKRFFEPECDFILGIINVFI
jgi:hypothetical protein